MEAYRIKKLRPLLQVFYFDVNKSKCGTALREGTAPFRGLPECLRGAFFVRRFTIRCCGLDESPQSNTAINKTIRTIPEVWVPMRQELPSLTG